MKFLHTADLHLGKQLNDVSLLDDQRYALDQIVHIADDKKVDAVLISGDVYQKSTPSADAVELFDEFVSKLCGNGRKVFIISGNHDSPQRISYFSSLVKSSGVYISESFDGKLQSYESEDVYGKINIHLLPFLKPLYVKRYYPEEKITTYEDAVKTVLKNSPIDKKERNILLCHQFITGSEMSDSEERAVGGLDNIGGEIFDDFDYVALGHIHKPQKMLRETMRYSGSILKYSFSEAGHKKSVTVFEIGEKDDITVETVMLYPLHDLRLAEGELRDIMKMDYSEDYVWVTVHDEIVPPDAKVTVSTVFPNMMKFSVVNSKTKYDIDVLAKEKMENKSVEELFSDFYRLQNNDIMPSEAHMAELGKVLKEMEGEI